MAINQDIKKIQNWTNKARAKCQGVDWLETRLTTVSERIAKMQKHAKLTYNELVVFDSYLKDTLKTSGLSDDDRKKATNCRVVLKAIAKAFTE